MSAQATNHMPFVWNVVYCDDDTDSNKVTDTITLSDDDGYRFESLARFARSPCSLKSSKLGQCSFFIDSMMLTHFREVDGRREEVTCRLHRTVNLDSGSLSDSFGRERYKLEQDPPPGTPSSWLPLLNWDESYLLDLVSTNKHIQSLFLYRPWVKDLGKFAIKGEEGRFTSLMFLSQREGVDPTQPQVSSVLFTMQLKDTLLPLPDKEQYGMPPSHEDGDELHTFLGQRGIDPPHAFLCPITHMVMKYPCSASDGKLYEMTAIQRWIKQGNKRSPCTGKEMNEGVYPCHYVRDQIADWVGEKRRGV